MEELWQEFEKLQEEFHETIENYPLLEGDIDEIFDNDIKEIEELLDKNDEYYLKKAITKLKDLIDYIKDLSYKTDCAFKKYNQLAERWNSTEIKNKIDNQLLSKINSDILKSNELIQSKQFEDVNKAVQLFQDALKKLKEYIS